MKKTWVISFAASASIAASLTAGPVKAAFPGQNGLIAYDGFTVSQADIFVVNPDGSFATNITNTKDLVELAPQFSADGTRIAFQRSGTDFLGSDIWTMAADGSGQVQVTDTPKIDETYPSYSPDGTRIVFERYDTRTSKTDLWISGSDGTGAQAVTTTGDISYGHISWSPDGTKIVYARALIGDKKGGISILDVASGVSTGLTSSSEYQFDPDFSPDGTKIVYAHSPNTGFQTRRLMNIDGTEPTTLFTDDENTYTYMGVWAPDGSGILVSASEEGRPALGLIDLQTRAFTEMFVTDGFTISWQPCSSSCPTLSTPASTEVEISAYNTRRATLASIRVIPLHPGGSVEVTYSRRTDGPFRKIATKQVELGNNGSGNVRLRLFKSGRCRIQATFAGDADHLTSSSRVTSRCNRFFSGAG